LKKPLQTERTRRFTGNVDSLSNFFRLSNLAKLSERDYEGFIGPYRTDIPYPIFRRNVIAALGQSKQPEAIPLLRSAMEESNPEIREIASTSLKALENSQTA